MTSLESGNDLLNKIRHLHLYHGSYNIAPTYTDLMKGDLWGALEPAKSRITTFAAIMEVQQCSFVSIDLRHSIDKGFKPLPNLRTVSLGGFDKSTWTTSTGKEMEQDAIDSFSLDNVKGIPQVLMGLESVQHLCQSVECGPLALLPMVYRPWTPLKVFTYHVRQPLDTCTCAQEVTPIVVGAVNRYYYTNLFTVNYDQLKVWSEWAEQKQNLIGVIIETFGLRNSVVVTRNMGRSGSFGIDRGYCHRAVRLYTIRRTYRK
jgi:hypothetical protein